MPKMLLPNTTSVDRTTISHDSVADTMLRRPGTPSARVEPTTQQQ